MDREQFIGVLQETAAVYSVAVTENWVKGYLVALDGVGWQEAADSMRRATRELKFMPRPSDILLGIEDAKRQSWRLSTPQEPELSPIDRALGEDLAPLFGKYLRGETTLGQWIKQMEYFADKHGCGDMMRREIADCGLFYAKEGGK